MLFAMHHLKSVLKSGSATLHPHPTDHDAHSLGGIVFLALYDTRRALEGRGKLVKVRYILYGNRILALRAIACAYVSIQSMPMCMTHDAATATATATDEHIHLTLLCMPSPPMMQLPQLMMIGPTHRSASRIIASRHKQQSLSGPVCDPHLHRLDQMPEVLGGGWIAEAATPRPTLVSTGVAVSGGEGGAGRWAMGY